MWKVYENKYCQICQKGLLNTALMLTAKSGRGVHQPAPAQAELFTHTTVNGKKLATSKFQSRRGGDRGQMPGVVFFNPSHSYLDHLTVIELNKSGGGEDHPPTTHTKSGF